MAEPVSLKKLVGAGYDDFWNCRKFYRVCKGSKGSKKSKTAAYWFIYNMMKYYPYANTLVIRRYFADIRDSCFTDLLWAIDHLGVTHLWRSTNVPMEIIYQPYGPDKQCTKIMFRGLDDASKIASITVRTGVLCWMWIEEAYQVTNELEFEKLQMSLRGVLPEECQGLFQQITLTFNPWSEHCWLKTRFFDRPTDPEKLEKWEREVFTKTTTYKCNEWLSKNDRARYDELYLRNPARARVICDGDWGISEGVIFENWDVRDFDVQEIKQRSDLMLAYGLDFGYSEDPCAFTASAFDMDHMEIWVFDEMYEKKLTNIDIIKRIIEMGYGKERIIADSSEPKSVTEIFRGYDEVTPTIIGYEDDGVTPIFYRQHYSLPRIQAAMKGNDSIHNGIQRLQAFRIHIHPKCMNLIKEMSNYCYDTDQDGNLTDKPIDSFNHGIDSLRYASERFFRMGRGRVVEAKGSDGSREQVVLSPQDIKKHKCRRVVSTL